MDIAIGIVVGLLVLMALVTLHEFGHFIAARKNGVNVLEFGIGFPPRAIAWKKDSKTGKWKRLPKSEWEKDGVKKTVLSNTKDSKLAQGGMIFSLNWLPIGGFCQMDGESAEDERPGTFGHASFWAKTKILFAGVAMNWLTAIIIFTVLAWTGMPEFLENQFTVEVDTRLGETTVVVERIADNSPATAATMKEGDKIVAIDGVAVARPSDVTSYNEAHAGEEVVYTVKRMINCADTPEQAKCPTLEAGAVYEETFELPVKLNGEDSEYLLGVAMSSAQSLRYSTWSAPVVGVGLTLQLTGETFKGVGQLVWNLISGIGSQFSFDANVRDAGRESISEAGESVSGPVGIIGVLFPAFTSAGPTNLAFLAALISVSLACMNVLPIPALDGGRWLLIAIYKIRRKKLTKETEEKIVSRAIFVLLALMAIVTVLDIIRIATGGQG